MHQCPCKLPLLLFNIEATNANAIYIHVVDESIWFVQIVPDIHCEVGCNCCSNKQYSLRLVMLHCFELFLWVRNVISTEATQFRWKLLNEDDVICMHPIGQIWRELRPFNASEDYQRKWTYGSNGGNHASSPPLEKYMYLHVHNTYTTIYHL